MKTYHCICHVCGRQFDHQSEFLSAGSKAVDGRSLAVLTCIDPATRQTVHSQQEIRESWNAGGFYGRQRAG